MNAMQAGPSTRKRFWLRGPLLFATLLIVLLALCLGFAGFTEQRASERVQAELDRVRDLGFPIDDVSMQRWFIEHTSDDVTSKWHDINRYVQTAPIGSVDYDRLPYVGQGDIPEEITPGGTWSDERAVAKYLSAMRPVIESIHKVDDSTEPVWQPIEFRGYMTLLAELQESRLVMRLLQLDVEHAIYERDAERALRGLDSMRKTTAAFDWPFCMVSELVQIALREQHQEMIRRSMAADIWNEDQLERLVAQLGPQREITERWTDIISGERAMMLASLANVEILEESGAPASVTVGILQLPSVRERLLSRYREMEGLAFGEIEALAPRAKALDQMSIQSGTTPQPLVQVPGRIDQLWLPAVGGMAQAFENEETSRRFTRTALAIKQFQLREGRWPGSLAELSLLEVPARDLQTVRGGPFGYEMADDRVYLWDYEPTTETRVAATRPERQPDGDAKRAMVTTIR